MMVIRFGFKIKYEPVDEKYRRKVLFFQCVISVASCLTYRNFQ